VSLPPATSRLIGNLLRDADLRDPDLEQQPLSADRGV
jgi:hypothetical protein